MNLIWFVVAVHCTFATVQETRRNNSIENVSTAPTTALDGTTGTDLNFTTEMTMTTCDANCSVLNETQDLNKTDLESKNVTGGGDIHKKIVKIKTFSGKQEFCVCDLQVNVCDINCCCDADCSDDDRLVFDHCERENLYYDTRYCDYMKYIYINNTPFEWHVNQNGLFCVVKNNLPPSYTLQRKQPLSSYASAKLEKNNKFTWPKVSNDEKNSFNSFEPFQYGSNIWLIVKDVGIKIFQLPKNFLSSTCVTREDIVNLKNIRHVCSQTDISEDNVALNLGTYFQNVSVVAAPNLLNISKYKNVFKECPKNVCLPIYPRICNENVSVCVNISGNDTRLNMSCYYDIRHNKNNCVNIVKKLQYNFYHNGTMGYNKVELFVVLANVSYDFGTDFEFSQEFIVNFWWTNQTKNFSAVLSGNPGYMIGKPILIGDVINVGNKTDVILKIDRFSDDYVKNFMTLPENVNGNCASNTDQYLPVEFGYNLLTKCKFSGTTYNRKTYFNATEVCRDIQRQVLKLWGIGNTTKTVAMFGNANANNPKEWTKILYSVSPEDLINSTSGRFSNLNTSLTCFGIVSNLIIDIFHSKINFKSLLNQEKILGVAYSFDNFVNTTLVYDKQKNTTHFEFDLESQVVFYDISVEKQKRFVDAPSLDIKLPYDFFYPFIKIENGGERPVFNYFVCICMYFLRGIIN